MNGKIKREFLGNRKSKRIIADSLEDYVLMRQCLFANDAMGDFGLRSASIATRLSEPYFRNFVHI